VFQNHSQSRDSMKRLIFLFLFAFTVIGLHDVFSESPPEKQTFELSVMLPVYEVAEVLDLSPIRYGTIEGVIDIYLAPSTKSENGKPINKARDKLSNSGQPVASIKGVYIITQRINRY